MPDVIHPFEFFRASLGNGAACVEKLRESVIGDGVTIPGPFGPKPLIYADYVASGRALRQVESFVMEHVLPYYANTHTEASFCGRYTGRLREAGRRAIAALCGATDEDAVIFTGSGATAGLNRIVTLFGLPEAVEAAKTGHGERPVVFIGPYEHHSNILPWRESGAEIIEIPEAHAGGPDLAILEAALAAVGKESLKIGAFSAASNVTGIMTDTDKVGALLRRYGAKVIWDYAGAGPYLPISMGSGTSARKDAIVISPHKFIGGPGASGVLIVRRAAVQRKRPVCPGGGTVKFVSPWHHDFSDDLVSREEAGTPNVVGDIRSALVFIVKDAIGQSFIDTRNAELRQMAETCWRHNPNIIILGNSHAATSLPIFSLRIRHSDKSRWLHQQLFTRMLSDLYGIQARGGCACAGPYAHRLLEISKDASQALRESILMGNEVHKPGWTRLNFSILLDDEKAMTIIKAVDELAHTHHTHTDRYIVDTGTARFKFIDAELS
ncbi:MAG: aminotransferase class V-fold PLP-dependent enzyme [Acetobacter sp.]|jgi:selenocysteine lyase/cysteine desulfurase|nr:aminotransferase class V-fold PLP-dependent enzyme [Acetobacter sp.]MCH4061593.1 aminotransferase class V-fold PLP-dependent enzyme [Acetobacter sp.]MCH4089558.1 aminotransferase class V-fold PLP-dependent enzyme [Acetobacter sp.]MCI1294724.1 aminotransferase class V-fold PLP-dependent enzyme [Acetobacter sp.]MCI1321411.1 aminotransferase class V-fold PLP-dependent enzyme [Acetobacter sp.]